MSTAKKYIIMATVFFAIITVFFHFIERDRPKISTETNTTQTNRKQIYESVNILKQDTSQEGKIKLMVYRNFVCTAIGEGCTDNPADGDKNQSKSIVGFVTNLIIMPFNNPPASGVYWVYDGLQNAGMIPNTYASEGIGFTAIKPYANLWKVVRDVSYMVLVIIMVAIGFMIMFRMKINPQTVISVENALPRIIVSLIMITFSFAIAGFLIDFMYISIALVISILSGNNTFYNASEFQNRYLNAGAGELFNSMFPTNYSVTRPVLSQIGFLSDIGNSLLRVLGSAPEAIIRGASGFFAASLGLTQWIKIPPLEAFMKMLNGVSVLGNSVGGLPSAVTLTYASLLFSFVAGIIGTFMLPQFIIGILIFLTMLLLLFRIFFLLLRSYLQIIILIIFAPFLLSFQAIGRNAFAFWFKNLFAEVITFPVVIAFFLVGRIFVNTPPGAKENLWQPPFLYGIDSQAFAVIAGMGIIFIIPDLVKLVKEFLGVKGLPVSIGPGAFFAGAGAAVGGGFGAFSQYGSLRYTAAHLGIDKFLSFLPGFGDARKAVTGEPGAATHRSPPPPIPGHNTLGNS